MNKKELSEILENHKKWISGEVGKCAELFFADLNRADLRHVDLSGADLSNAHLMGAYLTGTNLSGAYLRDADLSYAKLIGANLSGADLIDADLSSADLSGAIGILSAIDFMKKNFEKTEDGYIAYKVFNSSYRSPEIWEIKVGAVITENVNFNRCENCGCGINVAPLKWVKNNYPGQIWKVLIRWEWLCEVCVPYNTDGKIRCERVELLEMIDR